MEPVPAAHLSRTAGQLVFGTDAAGYHVGHIGYPDELYDGLFKRCVPHPDILEIGAGRGWATEGLWRCVSRARH